jgi:hypothetical protein
MPSSYCDTNMNRTFQEAYLSRRLLVFTDQQVSFYCAASSWLEGLGSLNPVTAKQVNWSAVRAPDLFDRGPDRVGFKQDYDYFRSLIRQYSDRQLTKEADAHSAFLGVLHNVRRSRPFAYTLYGLPFCRLSDSQSNGTIEQVLSTALSWYWHGGPDTHLRRPMFPSWTWIGWQGGGVLFPYDGIGNSLIRDVRLESASGQNVELSGLWEVNNQEHVQRAFDSVVILQFEAPVIPAAEIQSEHDWLWIAGQSINDLCDPNPDVVDNLIKNVQEGKWSCLILNVRVTLASWFTGRSRVILVVRWKEDQITAERVVVLEVYSQTEPEAKVRPLEDKLQLRCVRLI